MLAARLVINEPTRTEVKSYCPNKNEPEIIPEPRAVNGSRIKKHIKIARLVNTNLHLKRDSYATYSYKVGSSSLLSR